MDSLKELVEFLNQKNIDVWAEGFKNPENPFICDYTVVYDPNNNVRIYEFDEDSSRYNPFTGGIQTETIADAFNKHLYRMRKNFDNELNDLLFLFKDNENALADFIANTPDFSQLREKVKRLKCFSGINDMLIIYLGKIEEELLQFQRKALAQNKSLTASKMNGTLCFGCKMSREVLRSIYYNITLERGDFIDKEKTSIEQFIAILTSADVENEPGFIQFGCESTQVAFILTQIQDQFHNFTQAAIERSMKFKSKKGTLIKADSISKYKSVVPKEMDFIQDRLASIFKK